MKKERFHIVIFLLGILSGCLRWYLYAKGLDERGLIPAGSLVDLMLWVLTAAALVLCVLSKQPEQKAEKWMTALGMYFLAFGLLFSTRELHQGYRGLLTVIQVLSVLSAILLAVEGTLVFRGKSLSWLWLPVCLTLIVRLVGAYQTWSRDPQMQDFLLPLLAGLSLAAGAYRRGAERLGLPKSPWTYRFAMAAMYLCLAAAGGPDSYYIPCGVSALLLSYRQEEPSC